MKVFKESISSSAHWPEAAVLECYLVDMSPKIRWKKRPAVVICPGGAYYFTNDREAEPIALSFTAKGFHAFVLRYSVSNNIYPTALYQLALAVKLIRDNSELWNVDPNRIIISGFSAGGHLAAEYCSKWQFLGDKLDISEDSLLPNALVLGYPVITSGIYTHKLSMDNLIGNDPPEELKRSVSVENNINDRFPPTYIWHTVSDEMVPVFNSLLLACSLSENGIPYELHIFPYGAHGLGLANMCTLEVDRHKNDYCDVWFEEAIKFLRHYLNIQEG